MMDTTQQHPKDKLASFPLASRSTAILLTLSLGLVVSVLFTSNFSSSSSFFLLIFRRNIPSALSPSADSRTNVDNLLSSSASFGDRVTDKFSAPPVSSEHVALEVHKVLSNHSQQKGSVGDGKETEQWRSASAPTNVRGHCDISVGQWIKDDSYPLYSPGSCPFVDEAFSCHANSRPDSDYMRWRWAPSGCVIPRLNGTKMLERLKGKRVVFVGDSLNRVQWESLLCVLWQSLADKQRILEVQGVRISKLPGAYVFQFLDFNCSIEFYTSHFLVDDERRSPSGLTKFVVRLDQIHKSERRWRKADVLVFNTGHWWTADKIGEGDNYFQEGSTVYAKLDVMVAFRKAIKTWLRWVEKHVNPATTRLFFRGYSPVHYVGGQWNSGGQCQKETQPIFNESFLTPYPDKMRVIEQLISESRMTVPVRIINITRLSDYRKDAHPAIYGHPQQPVNTHSTVAEHQDCSHWCLPGLPDTWNELLHFALFFDP